MKKIFAIILPIIILALGFNTEIVFAADMPEIVVGNFECKPGDTVTVDVSVRNSPGIMYLELSPDFASELGEPDIKNGTVFSDFTKGNQYIWTADGDVNKDGKLLSVTFNIPADISVGNYPVGFIFRAAYNCNEKAVGFSVCSGKISVETNYQDFQPEIVIENKECNPGGAITVDISIINNPGIMYLELSPVFAPELGEPDVKNGTVLPDLTKGKQYVWTADSDVNKDGKLLSVTFNVPNETITGDYAVGFVFRVAYNFDEQKIDFKVKNGAVNVSNYTPGDINNDGEVDNKDLTRLFQHLSNWDVTVNEAALDVNGDDSVDNKDLTRLFQYLSNWDVEIF